MSHVYETIEVPSEVATEALTVHVVGWAAEPRISHSVVASDVLAGSNRDNVMVIWPRCWLTVNVWLAMVTVPIRGVGDGFGATVSAT
jgi:hypothetical protein